ncbi:unnamed protein product [Linum trigynum]|uniref:Uncharacterized protein n=1 Tax=Linum trigynum TaxID=586398 RepID=A0AAV2DIC4_9ROSI
MNPQNNQGSSSSAPVDAPLKRKRGRPRKDETLPQVESMSSLLGGFDHTRRNNLPFSLSIPSGNSGVVTDQAQAGSNMIGQPVSGVIDGKFDVGYLLKVKIGDTDTYMRGVAFIPDRVVPVTASNDLAPQARMYTRTEVQIPSPAPAAPLQPKVQGSIPSSSERIVKQSAHQPNAAAAQQFAPVMLPLTDKFQAASGVGPSAVGKMISQQVSDSAAASISIQSASGAVSKQDELLREFDASTRKVTDEKGPGAPPAAVTTLGVLPANRTVSLDLQIQHQSDGLKASQSAPALATDEGKITSLEHIQPPPAISIPGSGIFSSQSMSMCLGSPTFPGKAAPPELPSAAPKVTTTDTPSLHPNGGAGGLVGNVAPIPEPDAMPKPDSEGSSAALQKILESQFGCSSVAPMELFEKESAAAATTEPKLGHNSNVLPGVSEPQLCNATPSASVDCNNIKES